MRVDFVILTALEEERDAVLSVLPAVRKLPPTQDDIRVYFQSELPIRLAGEQASVYHVIVTCLLNMGRVEAANAANDAIRHWQPSYVLLVGIAGGIAEAGVELGDVIISDQVVDYELQKITSRGPQVRYSVHRVSPRLLAAAENLLDDRWALRLDAERPEVGTPKRLVGPIATGDKVIARKRLLERYQKTWPKLVGIEMESGGAASACYQAATQPGFFMVRGVSDLADEAKDATSTQAWRAYACRAAASYTIELISSGAVPAVSNLPRSENVETAPLLQIDIRDWFDADEVTLTRRAFDLFQNSRLSDALRVELRAPDFELLLARVRGQAARQTEPDIVGDQLGAASIAQTRMKAAEGWCAELLVHVGAEYGLRPALECARWFLRYFLSYILYHLAIYQTLGDPPLCTEVVECITRERLDLMPGLAWFAYRASPLVQVVIAGSSSPEHAKDSVTAYAPMTRLENDGSGGLITSLWESAEHIPKDIWLQYVVPQMASYSALGIPSYCGWIAKDAFYMARGHVYVDGVIDQSYGVRIGNTRHSVISQRDDKV